MRMCRLAWVAIGVAAMTLSGCAGDSSKDTNGRVELSRSKCDEIRAETNRLEARGVQHQADRAGRGEIKLSPAQKAEVDRYNGLLNQYLGGKCF